MTEKEKPNLKQIVDFLKNDSKFKILKNDVIRAFGDGVEYFTTTELESINLKILYDARIIGGRIFEEEIKIVNKKNGEQYNYTDYDSVIKYISANV